VLEIIFDAKNADSNTAINVTYPCAMPDSNHNNVFWNGSMDSVNGAYSPNNDALYASTVVQALYQEWYKLPMLINPDGSPMQLRIYTHYDMENSDWGGGQVDLGDGGNDMYPLTSLGVVAHEISHGFTSQHSGLVYSNQSGSVDEAFSDMSAQAAEAFEYGKVSWQIGPEIMKNPNAAVRYMDEPDKDCRPGEKAGSACSINSADEYDYLVSYGSQNLQLVGIQLQFYIVHLASGVFNHAFYYLATSDGWDVKKAFHVMIHANSFYWTQTSNFEQAACGVVKAAKDLHYDVAAVQEAFKKVSIDTKSC
jgi:pseudolysin